MTPDQQAIYTIANEALDLGETAFTPEIQAALFRSALKTIMATLTGNETFWENHKARLEIDNEQAIGSALLSVLKAGEKGATYYSIEPMLRYIKEAYAKKAGEYVDL